jgi:hypothetical protein
MGFMVMVDGLPMSWKQANGTKVANYRPVVKFSLADLENPAGTEAWLKIPWRGGRDAVIVPTRS